MTAASAEREDIFNDRRVYWVWISMVFGAGSPLLWELCRGYRDIADFARELKNGRLDSSLSPAQRARLGVPFGSAAELIERCESGGTEVFTFRSRGYPERLRHIPNPPAAVFARGDTSVLRADKPSVLIVGTRAPTAYSVRTSARLSEELAKSGVTVISGLEDGIDAVAGEAAADSEGTPAAVCGRGIESGHYAPEQMAKIAEKGVVLAEYTTAEEFGRVPFDKRNRLLCGLADAVVFIECRENSKGLSNVSHALRLGKPVLAVPPADIYDARFFGQRELLRAGAGAVFSADDILSAIARRTGVSHMTAESLSSFVSRSGSGRSGKAGKARNVSDKQNVQNVQKEKNEQKNGSEGLHKSEMSATIDMSGFSEIQRYICDLLDKSGALHINQLSDMTGCGIAELIGDLTFLRMEGAVEGLSGKRYALKGKIKRKKE